MKTVKIKVTKQDIKDGNPDNCKECAIACAIQRTLGIDMYKNTMGIYNTLDGEGYLLGKDQLNFEEKPISEPFPPKVTKFIQDFDAGKVVKPISFDLVLI